MSIQKKKRLWQKYTDTIPRSILSRNYFLSQVSILHCHSKLPTILNQLLYHKHGMCNGPSKSHQVLLVLTERDIQAI